MHVQIQVEINNFKVWKLFLLITGFTFLLAFSINTLFLTEGLYYQTFGEKLAVDRITKMIEISQKWQWIGYVFITIILLIRVGFTAICLYIGCLLANIQVKFKELFKVALLADFVFLLAGITKLVILVFFKNVSKLVDLQFQPLSLMELFNRNSVDTLFIYPFSLISVFELLYWLVLAWLLARVLEKPLGYSLKRVASSYGTGLLLWVLFMMFLTVNLT
ncbi:MAG: hypothetical protein NTZ69_02300 [Bacteroidia bacterium]|nr:hypothetical protein [Bacteroidia bacterium]